MLLNSSPLFNNHSLQSENISPILNPVNTQQWISWLSVACFALIVWMFTTERKKINLLIGAAISNRNVEELIRKEYAISNRISIVLSLVFLITSSLFIYQTDVYFNWINTPPGSAGVVFSKIFACVLSFIIVKALVIRSIGFVFELEQESFMHVFTIFLFNEVIGLFIFPLVVFTQFSHSALSTAFLYITIAFFAFMYIYKLLRLMVFGQNNLQISKIHLFLYLCTLEILPLIVTIKLFVSGI